VLVPNMVYKALYIRSLRGLSLLVSMQLSSMYEKRVLSFLLVVIKVALSLSSEGHSMSVLTSASIVSIVRYGWWMLDDQKKTNPDLWYSPTLNPKPESLIPDPCILNPQLQTLTPNPKPSTL